MVHELQEIQITATISAQMVVYLILPQVFENELVLIQQLMKFEIQIVDLLLVLLH